MDYQDFQPGSVTTTTWMYHPALLHKHSHLGSPPTGSACTHVLSEVHCWWCAPTFSPAHSSYRIIFNHCSCAKIKILLNINIFTSLAPSLYFSQPKTNIKKPTPPHNLWCFPVRFILSLDTCLLSEVFALPPLVSALFTQTLEGRQLHVLHPHYCRLHQQVPVIITHQLSTVIYCIKQL